MIVANITQRTRLPRRDPGPFFDFKFWKDPRFSLFEVGFFMVILGRHPCYHIDIRNVYAALLYSTICCLSWHVSWLCILSPFHREWIICIRTNSSRICCGSIWTVRPETSNVLTHRFNVLVPFALMNSVTIFTWFGMTIPGLYVFCVFFGFFQGAMISVQNAAIASICRDMREIGTMMGMGGGFVAIAYVLTIQSR